MRLCTRCGKLLHEEDPLTECANRLSTTSHPLFSCFHCGAWYTACCLCESLLLLYVPAMPVITLLSPFTPERACAWGNAHTMQ